MYNIIYVFFCTLCATANSRKNYKNAFRYIRLGIAILEHFNKTNEQCNLYLRKFSKSLLHSISVVPRNG